MEVWIVWPLSALDYNLIMAKIYALIKCIRKEQVHNWNIVSEPCGYVNYDITQDFINRKIVCKKMPFCKDNIEYMKSPWVVDEFWKATPKLFNFIVDQI